MHILLLNGPNLNLLGTREPEVYGYTTLGNIEDSLKSLASKNDVTLSYFQSNAEHEIIEQIHHAKGKVNGIIFNPAAYTHTSVAIRDALAGVAIPFIEVHLSNVHKREPFRHHSYFSDIAIGTIVGLGARGYEYAFDALHKALNESLNK